MLNVYSGFMHVTDWMYSHGWPLRNASIKKHILTFWCTSRYMSTTPLCTHRCIGSRNSCWAEISVFLMVIHDCTVWGFIFVCIAVTFNGLRAVDVAGKLLCEGDRYSISFFLPFTGHWKQVFSRNWPGGALKHQGTRPSGCPLRKTPSPRKRNELRLPRSEAILCLWWARGLHGCHPRKKERTCQHKIQEGNDGQVLGSQAAVDTTGATTIAFAPVATRTYWCIILNHVNIIDMPESAYLFVYIYVYTFVCMCV